MAFIDIKYSYQVDGILIGKRKNRLYNVLNNFVVEIKDVSSSEMRPVAMETRKSEPEDKNAPKIITVNPIYEFDENIYQKSALIWRENSFEAQDSLKELFKNSMDIAKIQFPDNIDILERPNLTIEKFEDSNYFFINSNNYDIETCEISDFKKINMDNKQYHENKIKKMLSQMIVVDGVIYSSTEAPELSCKYKKEAEHRYENLHFPFYMEDISPDFVQSKRCDLFVYDVEIFDKKENYGKILYNICFGNGLDLKLRELGISVKDIDEDIFFDKIKNKYDFGEELINKINLAKEFYNLEDVLEAISFVNEKYNRFSKRQNHIGNIKRYDKEYPSDHEIMKAPHYLYTFIDDIIISYGKNSLEKNNVFSEQDIKKNIDFSSLFMNNQLKL